jgi:hypothetical protein
MQERAPLPLEDKAEGIMEALVAALESQRSGWSISDPRFFSMKLVSSRSSMLTYACVCVCVRERDREGLLLRVQDTCHFAERLLNLLDALWFPRASMPFHVCHVNGYEIVGVSCSHASTSVSTFYDKYPTSFQKAT